MNRRLLLYGILGAALLLAMSLLTVFVMKRLETGQPLPNPIQMVKNWLFPPPMRVTTVINLSADAIYIIDEIEPACPEVPMDEPQEARSDG